MLMSISEVDRWVIPDILNRIGEMDKVGLQYSHAYCNECSADDGTTGLVPDFAEDYVSEYLLERIDEHQLTLGNHGIPMERIVESAAPDGTTAWIFSIQLDVLISDTKDDLLGIFGGKRLLPDSLKRIRNKRKYAIWGFDMVVQQKELGDWLYEQHQDVDDYEDAELEPEKYIRYAGRKAFTGHQGILKQFIDAAVADVRANAVHSEEDEEMFDLTLDDLRDSLMEIVADFIDKRIDYHIEQLNG